MATTEPAVRVTGLEKSFDEETVLTDIDFTVPAGELTLLMGPNGVGKTILLSCIAGGLHADEGAVNVFGQPPERAKPALNFMLQDGMLVSNLSGRANVSFLQALHPAATDEWEPILDRLAFDMDALDREVGDYSGGMRCKLEIALTLSADVPLLLLDEPTAALDVTTVDTLHSLLTERTQVGDTILMTSHRPGDTALADHLVILTADGVVATGAPDNLRAAVPQVVEVEGPSTEAEQYVRQGRLFESEVYKRGFLRDDVTAETVERDGDQPTRAAVREPTYVDLFNYYVHVK